MWSLFQSCFSIPDAAVLDDSKIDELSLTHQGSRIFSYKELKSATNGFHSSNKVGEGAFGVVYKGRLRDGTVAAIKVLSVELESMRGEREFIAEITALSNIKHQNLVTLKGCCVEGTERFLVYDYMENNNLQQTLLGDDQNRNRFNWETRKNIVMGIARGLAYLHEDVRPYIVHRDIKSSNILLDRDFNPKVSDFGLSKLLGDNISHISTRVAGTLGYIAPEYAISGRLTRKSDVYSFGVLLLEIVSGRLVVSYDWQLGEHHLIQKIWEAYIEEKLAEIIDPVLDADFPVEEAVWFLKIGLLCVQEATKPRPRMSVAVKMLTKEVDIGDVQISKPGLIIDLRDIHIEDQKSNQSLFSKESSSPTTTSLLI